MSLGRSDVTRETEFRSFAQFENRQEHPTPGLRYPELLAQVRRSITENFGLETNVDFDAAFGASVPHWPGFPDTVDALRVLKRHYKLVILSNVHRDGIAASTRKLGVEFDAIYTAEDIGGVGHVCRIFSERLYRALGAEDIRHRRISSPEVLLRRLLSLDYVLEHPELSWLPTEPEKVDCFERLGIPRRKLPRRVYRGAVGKTRRYFALKLPIAVEADKAVFVYVDPGHSTDKCLRTWGEEHRGLWEALQKRGRPVQVAVVAREDRALERAKALLRNWNRRSLAVASAADPSAAREYAEIKRAVLTGDTGLLDSYGGVTGALKRAIELEPLAQNRSRRIVIDGYSACRSTRLLGTRFGYG